MSYEFTSADDKLFRHDLSDWQNNAVLNYAVGTFPPYADGYRDGAIALANECLTQRGVNDILIYPIVFLSRQYIELRSKEIIIAMKYCNGTGSDFPKTHKIDELWFQLKKEFKIMGDSTDDEIFKNAENIILEFSKVDPMSMAFRYPVDKVGNNTITLSHINIRNFAEVFERLSHFLDALSDQVAHYADIASDMYRDFYPGNNE